MKNALPEPSAVNFNLQMNKYKFYLNTTDFLGSSKNKTFTLIA